MDPNESGRNIQNFVVQNSPGAPETATADQVVARLTKEPAKLIAGLSEVVDLTESSLVLTAEHNGKIFRCVGPEVPGTITIYTPEEDLGVPFSVAFLQWHVESVITFVASSGTNLYSLYALTNTAGSQAWACITRVAADTYNLSGNLA